MFHWKDLALTAEYHAPKRPTNLKIYLARPMMIGSPLTPGVVSVGAKVTGTTGVVPNRVQAEDPASIVLPSPNVMAICAKRQPWTTTPAPTVIADPVSTVPIKFESASIVAALPVPTGRAQNTFPAQAPPVSWKTMLAPIPSVEPER
jgi:hypothetical protein